MIKDCAFQAKINFYNFFSFPKSSARRRTNSLWNCKGRAAAQCLLRNHGGDGCIGLFLLKFNKFKHDVSSLHIELCPASL